MIGFSDAQTKRQIDNNPNDFRLFENFELTRKVYINETRIVEKVQQIKAHLLKLKQIIEEYKNKTISFTDLKGSQLKSNIDPTDLVNVQAWQEEFPTIMDWDGASGGLAKLLISYQVNLKKLSQNQTIEYLDENRLTKSFQCYESINSMDYGTFATKSMSRQHYGQAVHFLKEAFRVIPFDDPVRKPKEVQLKTLIKMRKDLVQLNNGYLQKRQTYADEKISVLPYLINDKLGKKKKQPDFIKHPKILEGLALENYLDEVCRSGQIMTRHYKTRQLYCRFLHHNDPYLKLAPFKEDHQLDIPYTVIFHDILSDLEIKSLVHEAIPNLSRTRYNNNDRQEALAEHEFKGGKKVKVVHKTVQAWLPEVNWPPKEEYVGRNYTHLNYPIFWKLAKKIELATQLQTQTQMSSTPMQVTNYGLGGLCEIHVDPHGYIQGNEVPPSREYLYSTGDMIGTFMAWLKDTEAGGGTGYVTPGYEGIVMPEKGAAAFWYDLYSNGHIDVQSKHTGCPVLKGSKWILNKWMYYFDNFKKFPCKLEAKQRFTPPDSSHYF